MITSFSHTAAIARNSFFYCFGTVMNFSDFDFLRHGDKTQKKIV